MPIIITLYALVLALALWQDEHAIDDEVKQPEDHSGDCCRAAA